MTYIRCYDISVESNLVWDDHGTEFEIWEVTSLTL